jgi:hypothetical protein
MTRDELHERMIVHAVLHGAVIEWCGYGDPVEPGYWCIHATGSTQEYKWECAQEYLAQLQLEVTPTGDLVDWR